MVSVPSLARATCGGGGRARMHSQAEPTTITPGLCRPLKPRRGTGLPCTSPQRGPSSWSLWGVWGLIGFPTTWPEQTSGTQVCFQELGKVFYQGLLAVPWGR
jgi:hypothetical protein